MLKRIDTNENLRQQKSTKNSKYVGIHKRPYMFLLSSLKDMTI